MTASRPTGFEELPVETETVDVAISNDSGKARLPKDLFFQGLNFFSRKPSRLLEPTSINNRAG